MKNANSAEAWDALWKEEGKGSWRGSAMAPVYERIDQLLPKGVKVLDIGGGVGILADKLAEKDRKIEIWDISPEAIKQAKASGHEGRVVDLEKDCPAIPKGTWVVATEVVEHLSERARARLLDRIWDAGGKGFLSVPNDRLGPEEEPQHTVQFSPVTFKSYLKKPFGARVEVLGPKAHPHGDPAFLLAVLGFPPNKSTLSVTLPVRDEAADLGRVLASFRGAADEIIIGVDPRTKDKTWEVAARYADQVFFLEDPEGPLPGKVYEGVRCAKMVEDKTQRMPDGGVHFAWVRNQCLDKCKSDWIFMTEGHELLVEGLDALMNLHQLQEGVKIAMVWRSDGHGQRWGFPWLHKNHSKILYERGTHNSLAFPDDFMVIKLPQIRTLHERDHGRSVERAKQRKIQNRISLMDDWMRRGSEFSKYYLASEWREFDEKRAESHFRELLAMPSKQGAMRYQSRLILAKLVAAKGDIEEARKVLLGCAQEDWSRTEHWVWLGDMAAQKNQWEEAIQFYTYGAARVGNPPFTVWWIDMAFYSYLPCQRLAMAYGELGDAEGALRWARAVLDQIPPEAPEDLRTEAQANIHLLEEALHEHGS